MTKQLITAVLSALDNVGFHNRITPFSLWYKGDHKRARTEASKALRALAKHLRTSKSDPELLEATKSYLDGFMAKATTGYGYTAMLKARLEG